MCEGGGVMEVTPQIIKYTSEIKSLHRCEYTTASIIVAYKQVNRGILKVPLKE